MSTPTPHEHLASVAQSLPALAREAARTDAADFLDPGSPSPTPGEQTLAAAIHTSRSELGAVQQGDLENRSDRLVTLERYEQAGRAGTLIVPDDTPRRRFVPWELAALGAGMTAELFALRPPVETLLRFDSGSPEGWGIAAVIVGVAALCGHFTGEATADAGQAETAGTPGWRSDRDRHIRRAQLLATGLVLVAVLAVLARVVTATLDASLDGATGMNPTEVGAFTIFQAVFAILTVVVGWSLQRRRFARERGRATQFLGRVADDKAALGKRINGDHARRAQELQHHETIADAAMATYRATLIHLCDDDVEARIAWTDRFATNPWHGWRQPRPPGDDPSQPPAPHGQPVDDHHHHDHDDHDHDDHDHDDHDHDHDDHDHDHDHDDEGGAPPERIDLTVFEPPRRPTAASNGHHPSREERPRGGDADVDHDARDGATHERVDSPDLFDAVYE